MHFAPAQQLHAGTIELDIILEACIVLGWTFEDLATKRETLLYVMQAFMSCKAKVPFRYTSVSTATPRSGSAGKRRGLGEGAGRAWWLWEWLCGFVLRVADGSGGECQA